MDVLTAISLCSGYEGLGLGLKRAIPNVRTVCYVERETYAVANLVAKIKEGKLDDAPIWDDLATFDPEPYKGMVHIIHGGYPCQGFSVAGKRLGTKDPRWVWPHIARIVEAVKPVWCIFENVPGHLSLGFPEVYCSLRDMGYKVEAGLFTAAEVALPTNGSDCLSWPSPDMMAAHREGKEIDPENWKRQQAEKAAKGINKQYHLNVAVNWPTPTSPRENSTGDIKEWGGCHNKLRTWPTPHSNCVTGAGRQGREGGMNIQTAVGQPVQDSPSTNGKSPELWYTPESRNQQGYQVVNGKKYPRLEPQVQSWATPASHERTQDPRKVDHGIQLANQAKGKLNPAWVEQLMGLPVGWTAFDCSETGSCRNVRKKQ